MYPATRFASWAAITRPAVKRLRKLLHDDTVERAALLEVIGEIVEAEDDLAATAAEEVQGYNGTAGKPAKKWLTAFGELGKQLTNAVTTLPAAALEQRLSTTACNSRKQKQA